jgi:predicted nucleotidyltransferase
MIRVEVSKDKIQDFCLKWKVTELALFGSVLREDFGLNSDVDVLVSFEPAARWSLMAMVEMQDELEKILGRKVDLVERSAIERSENYIRRRHILASAEPFYVAHGSSQESGARSQWREARTCSVGPRLLPARCCRCTTRSLLSPKGATQSSPGQRPGMNCALKGRVILPRWAAPSGLRG